MRESKLLDVIGAQLARADRIVRHASWLDQSANREAELFCDVVCSTLRVMLSITHGNGMLVYRVRNVSENSRVLLVVL